MATNILRTFCRSITLVDSRARSKSTALCYYRVRQMLNASRCRSTTSSSWPGVEQSGSEFKWVDRILPRLEIPEPPKHAKYPTPSGWVPPSEESASLPYYVRRTRFHHLPVYIVVRDGGVRKLTIIRKVEGDIWAFEAALREALEKEDGEKAYAAVDEVCCKVWVRGERLLAVSRFLLEKGF